MIATSTLAQRIDDVRARISRACARAGRDDDDVTLVAVSKTHGPPLIAAAYDAGLRDFGENRVQEGATKIAALRTRCPEARWHLVGHLQTNKAKAAIECFDILHGVDSERLATAIDRAAKTPVKALIEVNVAGEDSKYGLALRDVERAASRIRELPHVDVIGLMTVAPQVDDPEEARPVFRRLRELRDAVGLAELSMGMTDDFEVAVEEGSTLVRVGRAIFGPRDT
jgi:pyridoxal phosphate enzyme (YggS family)